MTQDAIIHELGVKGIITFIAGEYFITEKYKELLSRPDLVIPQEELKTKISHDEILNTQTNGSDWPTQILEGKGRDRATALMDLCKIPSLPHGGGYRLRGLNNDALNIVGNIIESDDINPATFIEAVEIYYKYTEKPKSFKNLLIEGDILEIYQEHIEGKLLPSMTEGNSENKNAWN